MKIDALNNASPIQTEGTEISSKKAKRVDSWGACSIRSLQDQDLYDLDLKAILEVHQAPKQQTTVSCPPCQETNNTCYGTQCCTGACSGNPNCDYR